MKASTPIRLLAAAAASLTLFAACSDSDKDTTKTVATEAVADTAGAAETTVPVTDAAPSFEGDLVGTFALDAGDCTAAAPTGSYFQMVQPGGTAEAGPFVPNADSACKDTNFTLLAPGTDGGLTSGTAQASPTPAFDANNNALVAAIAAPAKFFGSAFGVATDGSGPIPSITATGGTLSGDLSSFTAYWGGGTFSQGSAAATGTIDPTTGDYTLTWTSLISGGSFNGFTGVWHLQGTFTPKG